MNKDRMRGYLETERLVLFPYTKENLALFNRDLGAFEDYFDVRYRGEELDYLLKGFLLKLEDEIAADPEHFLFFTEFLIVKKDDSRIIGSIDYKSIPKDGVTEVGYGMNPAYTGHGYMTEALRAFLDFGRSLGIRIVRADTLPDNIPSQNVLKRCGFRFLCEDGNLWWEIDLENQVHLSAAHRTIVDAVIRKAAALCPDSLALIGVYGSAATGDTHAKSDLDLMILVEDERGFALSSGFILDDTGVGYDLYCTTWESLEHDAACPHAQLGKLLDAKLVYINHPAAVERLEGLRNKARAVLASPERHERAAEAFDHAKLRLADCFLTQETAKIRAYAADAIYSLLDALMLSHGKAFRRGTKRTFEELGALALPFDTESLILDVIRGTTPDAIRTALIRLIRETGDTLSVPREREAPSPENLSGTYEEMFSNWHGKMQEAADRGDVFSSFMNLASLGSMLVDIAADVAIPEIDALGGFDPDDLEKNARVYDEALAEYEKVYHGIGIAPKHYPDAQAFAAEYLGGSGHE